MSGASFSVKHIQSDGGNKYASSIGSAFFSCANDIGRGKGKVNWLEEKGKNAYLEFITYFQALEIENNGVGLFFPPHFAGKIFEDNKCFGV